MSGFMTAVLGRPPLPEQPNQDYWCVIDVLLRETVQGAVGYKVVMGIRCAPEGVQTLVNLSIRDGDVRWEECSVDPVAVRALPYTTRRAFSLEETSGVWHRSGRILYLADE